MRVSHMLLSPKRSKLFETKRGSFVAVVISLPLQRSWYGNSMFRFESPTWPGDKRGVPPVGQRHPPGEKKSRQKIRENHAQVCREEKEEEDKRGHSFVP